MLTKCCIGRPCGSASTSIDRIAAAIADFKVGQE
jgi:hypothetical protein